MIRVLAIAVMLGSAANAAEVIAGRASVIDGDTLEIRGERIRLFGIGAPEVGQTCKNAKGEEYRCGQKAALILDARIGDGVVTCEHKDTDQYGRKVGICRVYGEDLGAWMVGLGWAVAYRTYTSRYIPAEDLARSRRAGVFTPPAQWRREHEPRPNSRSY
jgi:endonuclease YncB( thermonuclease family)